MRLLLPLLVLSAALAADTDKSAPLRYLRPGKDRLVLESEVTRTTSADGSSYVSVTDRGSEKMTLRIKHDPAGKLVSAEVLHETAKEKQSAVLTIDKGRAQLRRGDKTEEIALADNVIVTTAPDWTDIFDLVRRYDAAKGGKQEFAGLWIHPSRPTQHLPFTVEKAGEDTVRHRDRPLALDRYRVRLRSGDYLVWADATRRVVRLIPAGRPAAFVVLEGYEESTRDLGAKP